MLRKYTQSVRMVYTHSRAFTIYNTWMYVTASTHSPDISKAVGWSLKHIFTPRKHSQIEERKNVSEFKSNTLRKFRSSEIEQLANEWLSGSFFFLPSLHQFQNHYSFTLVVVVGILPNQYWQPIDTYLYTYPTHTRSMCSRVYIQCVSAVPTRHSKREKKNLPANLRDRVIDTDSMLLMERKWYISEL